MSEFMDNNRDLWPRGIPLDPAIKELLEDLEADSYDENGSSFFLASRGDEGDIEFMRGISVPDSALDGESSPVIFPSAEKNIFIAAFSEKFLKNVLEKVKFLPQDMHRAAWQTVLSLSVDEAFLRLERDRDKITLDLF